MKREGPGPIGEIVVPDREQEAQAVMLVERQRNAVVDGGSGELA